MFHEEERGKAGRVILKNEHPMLEHIKQSNLIEGVNSRKADRHSLEAWLWLEKQPEITHELIWQIHRLIMRGLMNPDEIGTYRRCNVQVGGRLCPHWEHVDALMENVIYGFKTSNDPVALHIQYELVHPFRDGNGRTGRMLMWWHQVKLGQKPTIYKASERWAYYELFGAPKGGPMLMD